MAKNNIYNRAVLIKTYSGVFDCIGIIKEKIRGDYDKHTDSTKDYYEVQVLTYVHGNYSKKEQRYYLREVSRILTKVDAKTVNLLYTGD